MSDSAIVLSEIIAAAAPRAIVPPAAPGRRGLGERALQRVIDCVHANLADELSLERLAAAACISRFHFARLFRARTGMSPMQYVKQERIALARYLLTCEEGLSLSRIAVALGFFDQSHFTRVFRHATGMSPGCYARRQRSRAGA